MCYVNCTFGVDRQNSKDLLNDERVRSQWSYNITRPFHGVLRCVFIVTFARPCTHIMCAVIQYSHPRRTPDKANSRRNLGRNRPIPCSPPAGDSPAEPIYRWFFPLPLSLSTIYTTPINDRNCSSPIRIGRSFTPNTAVSIHLPQTSWRSNGGGEGHRDLGFPLKRRRRRRRVRNATGREVVATTHLFAKCVCVSVSDRFRPAIIIYCGPALSSIYFPVRNVWTGELQYNIGIMFIAEVLSCR